MYEEEEEGNVRTYKILGSLEILAIKNNFNQILHCIQNTGTTFRHCLEQEN